MCPLPPTSTFDAAVAFANAGLTKALFYHEAATTVESYTTGEALLDAVQLKDYIKDMKQFAWFLNKVKFIHNFMTKEAEKVRSTESKAARQSKRKRGDGDHAVQKGRTRACSRLLQFINTEFKKETQSGVKATEVTEAPVSQAN